jgi:hypothetical protein
VAWCGEHSINPATAAKEDDIAICRRKTLEAEAARLEQLRPVLATPHWRKNRHGQPRYLYLIHPTQDDGSCLREYIGADPEAQAAALARVEAWDELQATKSEMRGIDHRLAAVNGGTDEDGALEAKGTSGRIQVRAIENEQAEEPLPAHLSRFIHYFNTVVALLRALPNLLVSRRASIENSSSLGVGRENLPAQTAQDFER